MISSFLQNFCSGRGRYDDEDDDEHRRDEQYYHRGKDFIILRFSFIFQKHITREVEVLRRLVSGEEEAVDVQLFHRVALILTLTHKFFRGVQHTMNRNLRY